MTRETRYAKTADGVYIAYQVVGSGPVDFAADFHAFAGNVDLIWDEPDWGPLLSGLAEIRPLDHPRPSFRDRLGRLLDWTFWVWAVVGVGFGFGISAIGIFTVPVALVVTILLLRLKRFRGSVWGLLIGVGALPLAVAWDNRDGPGEQCRAIDGGTQCDELYDPRKWLFVGLVFILAGLAAQLWSGTGGSASQPIGDGSAR